MLNVSVLENPAITLKLSIQRALVGEVTHRLHSVTCGLRRHVITVRAYFFEAVTPGDVERIQLVCAQVIADFPEGYLIEEECRSLNEGDPETLDFWGFQRADES